MLIEETKIINVYKIKDDFIIVHTDNKWFTERNGVKVLNNPDKQTLAKEILDTMLSKSPNEETGKWDGKYNDQNVWEEAQLYWGVTLNKTDKTTKKTKVNIDKYIWSGFGEKYLKFTGLYNGSDGTFVTDNINEELAEKVTDFMLNAGENE